MRFSLGRRGLQPLDSIPNALLSVYSQTLDRRRAAVAAANEVVTPMNLTHTSGILTLSPKTPSMLDPYDLIYLLKWYALRLIVPLYVPSGDGLTCAMQHSPIKLGRDLL